jgi:boron transporter
MAQGNQFPLRKPPGFHYDFFILGITTFIAGLLGVPAPNGLIPQAPIHTTSLLVMSNAEKKEDIEVAATSHVSREKQQNNQLDPIRSRLSGPHIELEPDPTHAKDGQGEARQHEKPIAVVEQRVSNLAQGTLCLVLLTGPFLHVLNLIPRGVLAGLL